MKNGREISSEARGKFRQWESGPETRFSVMRPFSIGFEFANPVRVDRVDRLELLVPVDMYYDHDQCRVETGQGRGWQKIDDEFLLECRYPEVYRLRGIHTFAAVTVRGIRFVLVDAYRQHYDGCALYLFAGGKEIARHDPLVNTPYFEFRKKAFGSFTEVMVQGVEKADAPARFTAQIKRQRQHLWSLRDTLGDELLRGGQPDQAALESCFPPIRFGSTVIGHPGQASCNVRVDWNGTMLFDPYRGQYGPDTANLLHNCAGFYFRRTLAFRAGPDRVRFGHDRDRLRELSLEKGFLPLVSASYREKGVDYGIELFSLKSAGRVECWLRFRAVNRLSRPAAAWLGMELRNFLLHEEPRDIRLSDDFTIREGERDLLRADTALRQDGALFYCERVLKPGTEFSLHARINPSWYETPALLPPRSSAAAYDRARRRFLSLWQGIIRRGATYRVPEPRFQHGFYAGIVSLLLFSDEQRGLVYYGSMSTYDRTIYYLESPHSPLALGMAGLQQESCELYLGLFAVLARMDPEYFQYLPFPHYMAGYGWQNYLLWRDRKWLKKFAAGLRAYMDDYIALLDRSPKGILPPRGFGGDIQDRRVYSLNSDLCGCWGLLAYAAMLAELAAPEAAEYQVRAGRYLDTVIGLLEQTMVDTAWGRKAYSLILDDDGGAEFYFRPDEVKVVKPSSVRLGEGAHQFYFGKRLQPVHRNNFTYYLAIFTSTLLGSSLMTQYPRQKKRMVSLLEQGGGVFGGLFRAKGLDINPTYAYGYRRSCIEDGKKDRFVLAAKANLYAATSSLFQSGESFRILPFPRWGEVEHKRTVGVSENFVGRIRSCLDLFFLEVLNGPCPAGRVIIAGGVPDAWFASSKPFGVKKARFSGGRIDVWISRPGRGQILIAVTCPELTRQMEFQVVLPGNSYGAAEVAACTLPYQVENGHATVFAGRSFEIELCINTPD